MGISIIYECDNCGKTGYSSYSPFNGLCSEDIDGWEGFVYMGELLCNKCYEEAS